MPQDDNEISLLDLLQIVAVNLRLLVLASLMTSLSAQASDVISANGYSGLGLVPSAQVLTTGAAVLNFDTALPGIVDTAGYNN